MWCIFTLLGSCNFVSVAFSCKNLAPLLQAPDTSEPPIFGPEHNVQFFYRFITGNESNNQPDEDLLRDPNARAALFNAWRPQSEQPPSAFNVSTTATVRCCCCILG